MGDTWVTFFLRASLEFFSSAIGTVYEVLSINPVTYRDGAIWDSVSAIYNGLLGSSVGLMAIFFFIGLIGDVGDMMRRGNSDVIYMSIIMLCIGAGLIYAAPYLLLLMFWVGKELMDKTMFAGKSIGLDWVSMPDAIQAATEGMGIKDGIIFWFATTIAALVIMVCCFSIILVVYGRLFKIYIHIAISPLPFACAVSSTTRPHFLQFVRSFAGVALEGVVILIAVLVFSAFANSYDKNISNVNGTADTAVLSEEEFNALSEEEQEEYMVNIAADALQEWMPLGGGAIWKWLCEQLVLFLLMASVIKGADKFVAEKLGL